MDFKAPTIALGFAVSILLLLPCPRSQTKYIVSPAYYENAEGASNNTYPFGFYYKWSYQQVHDDLKGRPRVISELSFRPDGAYGNIKARSITLTLKLSSTNVTSKTATNNFASNHGKDVKTVLSNVTVNWPSTTKPAKRPGKFVFTIPFPKTPFIYKNTAGLCWEVRIHSMSTRSSCFLDSAFTNQYPPYFKIGKGCRATGQSIPADFRAYLNKADSTHWKFYFYASYLAKSQPALWVLGDSSTRWGPFTLPLDLTPFGAGGCHLYTSILLTIPGATDSNGRFTNSSSPFLVTYDPVLYGFKVFSQALSLDPGRTPLPLVFTNGNENVFHPFDYQPLTRLYTINDDTATTAKYIFRNRGLITRFTYY